MTSCDKYSTAFISRFVDNEVSQKDHDAFIQHKAVCGECSETEAKFRRMAKTFDRHARSGVTRIQNQLPPISLEKRPKRITPLLSGFSRPMGLRLASIGAVALILVMAVYPWSKSPVPGPSAIVNSVDTYGSSVMIIESSNTQHTIIWFSET